MPDSHQDRQDAFSKRLQQMQESHAARTETELTGMGWDPASLPLPPLHGSIEEQMAAYNDWLDERICRWRNEPPAHSSAAINRRTSQVFAKEMLKEKQKPPSGFGGVKILSGVDEVLFEDFELKRFPPPSKAFLRLPRFYEDYAQFVRAIGEGFGFAASEVETLLSKSSEHAGSVKAVFLPGFCCLINGSCFPGLRIDELENGEISDFEARIDVLRGITQSKWGWGFLLEYTAQGRAMQQNGMYAAWVCRELGYVPDRLKGALAYLDVIEHSLLLALEGWQDWIWGYLYQKQHIRDPEDQLPVKAWSNTARLTVELVHRLAHFIKFDWGNFVLQIYDVADLLNFIAFQFLRLPERADEWMRNLEDVLAETKDEQLARLAEALRTYLSQKYFNALEARLGSYCMPYVMIIIFHIEVEQYPNDLAKLRTLIRGNAQWNANKRLLLISQLSATVSYDPHALRIAVRDQFRLNTPDEFFRKAGL